MIATLTITATVILSLCAVSIWLTKIVNDIDEKELNEKL